MKKLKLLLPIYSIALYARLLYFYRIYNVTYDPFPSLV